MDSDVAYNDNASFEVVNNDSRLNDSGLVEISYAYCNSAGWKTFSDSYKLWHGQTSVLVCVFGCIANLLNLVVLTRKGMISPTNAILTGLALADLFNMVEYIPYAFFMYIWKMEKTYGWAFFVLAHANFSQVCHTISIWLTLTLAVWRYIAVGIPTRSVSWCTMNRAKWAIASAYIFSPILSIPVYLAFSIHQFNRTNHEVYYAAGLSDLAQANNQLLQRTNFWIYSVVIKLIPCIALTVVSYRLIHALMEAKRRKEKLLSKRKGPGQGGSESSSETADRTTRMLLAVLLLFLITEFPQAILGLLSAVLGDEFFIRCYMPLGDLMDFTALLNSAINFILYCVMSKKFRETFVQVFCLDSITSHFTPLVKSPKEPNTYTNNTANTTAL